MKKSRKQIQAAKLKARKETPEPMERRDFLRLVRNGGIGISVVAGAGFFGTRSVMATIAEHDLTRIGQGKPTVVQVHDPNCPTCRALQKQTRKALSEFGECDLVYLIASIKTTEGTDLANKYGVPHVTLLLFDAKGKHMQTLSGMHEHQQLEPFFRDLHEANKQS